MWSRPCSTLIISRRYEKIGTTTCIDVLFTKSRKPEVVCSWKAQKKYICTAYSMQVLGLTDYACKVEWQEYV